MLPREALRVWVWKLFASLLGIDGALARSLWSLLAFSVAATAAWWIRGWPRNPGMSIGCHPLFQPAWPWDLDMGGQQW